MRGLTSSTDLLVSPSPRRAKGWKENEGRTAPTGAGEFENSPGGEFGTSSIRDRLEGLEWCEETVISIGKGRQW